MSYSEKLPDPDDLRESSELQNSDSSSPTKRRQLDDSNSDRYSPVYENPSDNLDRPNGTKNVGIAFWQESLTVENHIHVITPTGLNGHVPITALADYDAVETRMRLKPPRRRVMNLGQWTNKRLQKISSRSNVICAGPKSALVKRLHDDFEKTFKKEAICKVVKYPHVPAHGLGWWSRDESSELRVKSPPALKEDNMGQQYKEGILQPPAPDLDDTDDTNREPKTAEIPQHPSANLRD